MTSLECRLLHIAEQSYETSLPSTGRFREIEWLSALPPIQNPVLVRREPDVALVGRIDQGIVLAFRGTRPPLNPQDDAIWATFLDWMNNGDCRYDADNLYAPAPHRPYVYPGNVHHGFARAVNALWGDLGPLPGVGSAIQRLLADGAPPKLLVVGHSKGGPLAVLGAWRAVQTLGVRARVFTIAGARPGDAGFRSAYETEARIETTRYEVRFDIVPYLPFGEDTPQTVVDLLNSLPLDNYRLTGYCPVGRLVAGGASLTDIAANALRSVLGFLTFKPDFKALLPVFVQAHLIWPGSAYARLICPEEKGAV